MSPFELARPRSLKDALALLEPHDAAVRPVSGGTAMMLMMKAGVLRPTRLVSLRDIDERYRRIELADDGTLRVGAMTTLRALERSEVVRRGWPVLARTLLTLANVRVRNVATVGGCLAHADPHMDLPPVLSALGASVTVVGPKGERSLAVEALATGYYETVLQRNELIVALQIPPQGRRRAAYIKLTTRSADDWPALGLAAVLETEGRLIRQASIVLGAATDRPTRLAAAEAVLQGGVPNAGLLRRAADAAVERLHLEGDARGSAAYKRELVRVCVGRAVRAALAEDAG